jgi:hypothetical protein
LLSRLWTTLGRLDARITKSAFAGAGLSIITGLLLGWFNGCFKADDRPDDGGLKVASRAQYATFVPQFACVEDRQLALEQSMLSRIPQTGGRQPTDEQRVTAIIALADYGRGARQNATEMDRLLRDVKPPSQFANDHQELVDIAVLLRKLVDELDRDLPANMSLAPSEILKDPTLNDRLMRLVQSANATAQALARRSFSQDFKSIYSCPNPAPRPTATRIPLTIVFPTVYIPPFFLTPFPTIGPGPISLTPVRTPTPSPFSLPLPTGTPFTFSSLVTPNVPFIILTPTPVR